MQSEDRNTMNALSHRRNSRAWLAALLALGAATALVWPIQAAPRAEQAFRIVVSAFPDLAGSGAGAPGCLGCDGQFGTGDAIRGRVDPLPAVEVILRGGDGAEIRRLATSQLANGRQQVSFDVPAVDDYQVELVGVPADWELCPATTMLIQVAASAFDLDTGTARAQYGFWHGCDTPTATPSSEVPTAEPASTATPVPTATAEVVPTVAFVATEPAKPEATAEAVVQTDAPGQEVRAQPVAPSAIRGLVFRDLDGDGQLAPDEPGLSDVAVHLASGELGLTQRTTGAGNYEFAGLVPGSYDVFIDVPAGDQFTNTDRYTNVQVDGEIVAGIDFGLTRRAASEPVIPATDAATAPMLPRTGVAPQSSGRVLLGLAALIGVLGLLGLALESGLARQS